MAILIKDMEIPDSCFLCRFCRRQEYGEYVGEDTAWSCVASKKRITDGQDLKSEFKHPDCPLVEVSDEQPEREFIKLTVRDSNGRPYYSIIYLEVDKNGIGHDFEGYSSYDLDVISDYLKRYFGFGTSAQPEKRTDKRTETHACDLIKRQDAIDIVDFECGKWRGLARTIAEAIEHLPSAQPERKKMSNKEWVDFLSEQFTVSRTSAREMLHGLMKLKAEDNFKKQFSGRK